MDDNMDECAISDLTVGTKIICGGQWHGVVVFNNTIKDYGDYKDEYFQSLGDGFMANYVEVGWVFQNDLSDIEIVK